MSLITQKSQRILTILAIIAIFAVIAILTLSQTKPATKKISIVATNFPAYDFARAVAGDAADIKMLVKPGAETHTFEPTPQDIIDIKNSQLFIYTGGESDEWIDDILKDIDANQTKTLKMMDTVEAVEEKVVEGMEVVHTHEDHSHEDESDEDHSGHDHETEYDEHVWTSPTNAIKIVEKIHEELAKISPENAERLKQNTEEYTKKLAKLDNEFLDIVNSSTQKTLIFGDRFPLRYFTDRYGLNYYAAFPGCSDQTEASSKTIAFLVDKVKTEKIPAIFKIEMSNGKIAEAISRETGVKVLEFNSAHNLSAEDFKNGITYIDLMERNLEPLREALAQWASFS